MITDRQRYEDRHRRIVQRCEQRLRERLEEQPSLTIDAIVFEYVREVRRGIARRDNSGIVAVFAVMASHLAMKKIRSDDPTIIGDVRHGAQRSSLSEDLSTVGA